MTRKSFVPGREAEILLVEDNPGDVRLVRELFTDAAITNTLHVATDEQEALDFLNQRGEFTNAPQPDLVLLDWYLPQATGDDILHAMRNDHELEEVPVIVLTGSDMGEDILDLSEIQADAYLTKPIAPDEFISLIRSFEFFWLTVLRQPSDS
ncbi:response regulator [Natrinema gelatinilyticum]|uniref:response regulator n=1 Tax=Natrinema gelatinilyticum TaxID=2961571 RepID=UPI0020C5331C|nr:response regulator [Natrinema gelatinilyticum]